MSNSNSNRKTHDVIKLCVMTGNNMRPQLLKTRHFQHNWPLVPPLSARICALEKILCQNIVDLRITEIVSNNG